MRQHVQTETGPMSANRTSACGRLLRRPLALLAIAGLASCAEMAEVLLEDEGIGVSYGMGWIVQEWDDPGWNTHNSTEYESEAACEASLAEQSRQSPDRGHRCIHESDLDREFSIVPGTGEFCYGCDWVVQFEEYGTWARLDPQTHRTEGVCQQALWHAYKRDPDLDYRCVNLDR